ncbi:hypothetical protein BO94DRAFT_421818, partial [Aspergillus sclerotioniger CBS 115572]
YTHYWSVIDTESREWHQAWPQLVQDTWTIIERAGIALTGPPLYGHETTPLVCEQNGIMINGVGEDGCECLVLRKEETTVTSCMTLERPYDLVVGCILLRAYALAPGQFDLISDGYWEDWRHVRQFYAQLWPD